MKRNFLFTILLFLVITFSYAQKNIQIPQLGKNKIEDIVAAMTIEEKVHQE